MRKSDRKVIRITASDLYLSEALKFYEQKVPNGNDQPFDYIWEIFTGKYQIVIEDDKITSVTIMDLNEIEKSNEIKASGAKVKSREDSNGSV